MSEHKLVSGPSLLMKGFDSTSLCFYFFFFFPKIFEFLKNSACVVHVVGELLWSSCPIKTLQELYSSSSWTRLCILT